ECPLVYQPQNSADQATCNDAYEQLELTEACSRSVCAKFAQDLIRPCEIGFVRDKEADRILACGYANRRGVAAATGPVTRYLGLTHGSQDPVRKSAVSRFIN